MGSSPNETLVVRTGDALVFSNHGEQGFARYVYTIVDGDHFTFWIETSPDGASWSAMMDGHFGRVA